MRRLRGSGSFAASFAGPLAAAFAVLSLGPALAATRIGDAAVVEREVSGSLPGLQRKVAKGDEVFLDELIRTAQASAAKIVFVDDTALSLGPQAAVKLDRFVFDGERSAKAMALTVGKGAMRWVSGLSPSSAYEVRTPQATIGVRGTIFDLLVEARRTRVVLQEGSVEVCTKGPRRRCKTLSRKGDVITVAGGAIDGPRPGGPGPSDFAARCLAATSRSCIVAANAEPAPVRAKRRLAERPAEVQRPAPRLRPRIVTREPPPRRRVLVAEPAFEEEIVPLRRYPVRVHEPWGGYDRPIRLRPPGFGDRPPIDLPNRGLGRPRWPERTGSLARPGFGGGRGTTGLRQMGGFRGGGFGLR